MINNQLGSTRFIYNWGLNLKIDAYKQDKISLSYVDIAKRLTVLKKEEGFEWLNEVANQSLQQSLRHMDSAFNNFFNRLKKGQTKGFPKFKSKHRCKDSATFTESKIDFDKFKIFIPKIGWVRIFKNKTFDLSYRHTSMTISRDHCGDYWCSIIVDNQKSETLKKSRTECTKVVGLDLGLKTFITDSQGDKVANPKFLEYNLKHLERLQRHFSKKQKESKRRERFRLKVAKLHRKITNQRYDFLHKLSSHYASSFDAICIEDLDVKSMLEKGILSKSISSASWSSFVSMLEYKCREEGCWLFKVDRYFPSSQTCSKCGHKNTEVKNLNVRKWTCPICGTEHDRDFNAAVNILNEGLKQLSA